MRRGKNGEREKDITDRDKLSLCEWNILSGTEGRHEGCGGVGRWVTVVTRRLE